MEKVQLNKALKMEERSPLGKQEQHGTLFQRRENISATGNYLEKSLADD